MVLAEIFLSPKNAIFYLKYSTKDSIVEFQAMRILKDEKEQDDKLRQQYKDKWSRTPSESLTQQLREDQSKYQTLLQRATEADAKVKSQFEANVDSMRVLSLPKVAEFLVLWFPFFLRCFSSLKTNRV